MKFSSPAQFCVGRAHMLRIGAKRHTNLCVEHLLFAVISFARGREYGADLSQEDMKECLETRMTLEQEIESLETASAMLEKAASDPTEEFEEADGVLSRVADMAPVHQSKVTGTLLAQAILEQPSPYIKKLIQQVRGKETEDDKKNRILPLKNVSAGERFAAAIQETRAEKRDKASSETPKPRMDSLEKLLAEKKDRQESPAPKPEKQGKKLTDEDIAKIREALKALDDGGTQQKKAAGLPRAKKRGGQGVKISFFVYRGGIAAAFIQHFLIWTLLPALLLFGLNYFTGALLKPPTPLAALGIYAFIVIWAFYLIRSLGKAVVLFWPHFALVLDILGKCALPLALGFAAVRAYHLPDFPVWMRVLISLFILIWLLMGTAAFQLVFKEKDENKKKFTYVKITGTPGHVFFQYLVQTLILPFILVAVYWIFHLQSPPWLEKTWMILTYFWLWSILLTLLQCLKMGLSFQRRHMAAKLLSFGRKLFINWALPAFVLYLHWLFDWFPMKVWVMIVLLVLLLVMLLATVLSEKK